MTHARSSTRTPDGARRARGCAALLAWIAVLACAAPAPATAAGEPQILAAGIDATDRFVVSWQLEPGTTFDFLEFSSVAIYNPFVAGAFAGRNVVASVCVLPGEGCVAPPSLTAYRATDPVSRDRRYYVKVNARRGGRGPLTSEVWVVDPEKPLLPGGGQPATAPTNVPVLGQRYKPPAARAIPSPKLLVQSPPKKIADVVGDGVIAHVICPVFACYAVVALQLGKTTLVFSDTTARAGRRETFVLRPRPARRALLQRRRRARLQVFADVIYPGGKRVQKTRRFTVRR